MTKPALKSKVQLTSDGISRLNKALRPHGVSYSYPPETEFVIYDRYDRKNFNMPDMVGIALPNGGAFGVYLTEIQG